MSKEENVENVEVNESEEATAETSVEAVQLTIQDMQAVANIVDLASRRGAFHAKEMETVGATYNKLSAFLEHIAAQQTASEEAAEGEEAPEGEAAPEASE